MLTGAEDRDAPPHYVHALATDLVDAGLDATHTLISGGGHHLALRHTRDVASALGSLLKAVA